MVTIQVTEKQAKEMYNSGIDSLKSIAESNFPELFHKEKEWNNIGFIKGFYISDFSNVYEIKDSAYKASLHNKNTFPTKKEAESALALSQLLQWRDKANGEKLHEWADFTNKNQFKCTIISIKNKISQSNYTSLFHQLSFKTSKIRDQFMKDHETLLKTYFMID